MNQYKQIINRVLKEGTVKKDRTGVGTTSIFNVNESFNLRDGFPLVTGKYTPFKLVAAELLWFLSGSTNNEDLRKIYGSDKATIWEEWASEDGDLGSIYGKQWRDFGSTPVPNNSGMTPIYNKGVDQIQNMIDLLRNNPDSRRMVVSAWNPSELKDMALEPCHYAFQLYTREASIDWRVAWHNEIHGGDGNEFLQMGIARSAELLNELNIPKRFLSCKVTQRSCDVFLGVPFNIASYALLTHLLAHCTNMKVDMLHWSGGDTHIYNNHKSQVEEYLQSEEYALPRLEISKNCPTDLFSIRLQDLGVRDYNHGKTIKADVAV